jgi:signal recognition particle subunit SRP54
MFGAISQKFQAIFASLSGKKAITAENIARAAEEVQAALLDADVSYEVAHAFVQRVREKAVGEAVVKSAAPRDQFIKVVHDELVTLMGGGEEGLRLQGSPAVILLCGLQGSGKTTQCAKLAAFLLKREREKKILVVACDLQRPAAIEQLRKLCGSIGVPLFALEGETNPVKVATEAVRHAKQEKFDVVILDTAGRLQIDEPLMQELVEVKRATNPQEVLLVASAATGQEAVNVARAFDEKLSITGTILTMLDGTARAGAAISIREVTKKPLKFEGIGEKITDFQPFNPRSMADRILGMGDVVNLVRKLEAEVDVKDREKLEKKARKGSFTYDDYLSQVASIKRMGSMKSLLQMLPGMGQMSNLDASNDTFKKSEAIILSMTPAERREKVDFLPSRRWRIAKGSGTTIDDVNRLIKGFKQMKDMIRNLPKNMENVPWQ